MALERGADGARQRRLRRRPRRRGRSAIRYSARLSPGRACWCSALALFLHRHRALRHRLLDAASDPDLRAPRRSQSAFSPPSPISSRAVGHGAMGLAFRRDRRAHLARRAAASPRGGGLRLVCGDGAAQAPDDRAHPRHARHLSPRSARSGRCRPRSSPARARPQASRSSIPSAIWAAWSARAHRRDEGGRRAPSPPRCCSLPERSRSARSSRCCSATPRAARAASSSCHCRDEAPWPLRGKAG